MTIPVEFRTARLHCRRWQLDDAEALLPVLAAEGDRLIRWIPRHVGEPVPLPELRARIQRTIDAAEAAREWRFGMFDAGGRVMGELSLFARDAEARVPLAQADRVEVGYWIRRDAEGQGLVNEAVRGALAAIAGEPRFACVEVRCDERNAPSGAIPRRLGFVLERTLELDEGGSEPTRLQVWRGPRPGEFAAASSS